VVPQGDHTWIAVGGDDAIVSARLATALGTNGDRLSGRAELASLKDEKVGAAGFFTARGLPEGAQQLALLFNGTTWGASETFDEAAQMPHRGVTPVLFSLTSQQGATPATLAARLQMPRDAIEDMVTSILRHGGF
jgi:hypothetical protein